MKQIESIYQKLLAAQFIEVCRSVIEGRAEVAGLMVVNDDFKALEKVLKGFGVVYRTYELKTAKMVLISKDASIFDQLEEISEAQISKELKDRYLENILNLRLK